MNLTLDELVGLDNQQLKLVQESLNFATRLNHWYLKSPNARNSDKEFLTLIKEHIANNDLIYQGTTPTKEKQK
jgi:hypothetical protein